MTKTKNEVTKLAIELSDLAKEFAILNDSETTPAPHAILLHTLGRMFQIMLTIHSIFDVVPIESLRGENV